MYICDSESVALGLQPFSKACCGARLCSSSPLGGTNRLQAGGEGQGVREGCQQVNRAQVPVSQLPTVTSQARCPPQGIPGTSEQLQKLRTVCRVSPTAVSEAPEKLTILFSLPVSSGFTSSQPHAAQASKERQGRRGLAEPRQQVGLRVRVYMCACVH